jgi:MOSC domain-containing protein YiiM
MKAHSAEPVMRVEHLFVSPGHNFFGHHGQPAGEQPIVAMNQIECLARRGIRGDRFFDYLANYKGQITFFSMEVFEALRSELNLSAVQPQATRRNVFVRGADLSALIGNHFTVQGIRFEAVEESKPCYWMNSALGPGAEEWLRGWAGIRCRILTDGVLRCEPSAEVDFLSVRSDSQILDAGQRLQVGAPLTSGHGQTEFTRAK